MGLLEYSRKVLNDMKGIFRYGNVLTKLLSSLNLTSAAHWKDEHEWHILWKMPGGAKKILFSNNFSFEIARFGPCVRSRPDRCSEPIEIDFTIENEMQIPSFFVFLESLYFRGRNYIIWALCVCVSMWISFHKMLTKEGG